MAAQRLQHAWSFVVVLVVIILMVSASQVVARVDAVRDVVHTNIKCADGKRGRGACTEGDEFVIPNQFAYSLMLEDFENGNLVVRPNESEAGKTHYLWGDLVHVSSSTGVSTDRAIGGSYSLKSTGQANGIYSAGMTRNNPYYNNNRETGGVNDWHFLNEVVTGWQQNRVNRMRLWVYLPASYTFRYGDIAQYSNHNFHVGTYLRHSQESRVEHESDNAHYYHYYNLQYVDGWIQILVDDHPSHKRLVGSQPHTPYTEHGRITEPFPTEDPGKGYFETMVWWYIETKDENPIGESMYVDNVELYEDPNNEDIDNIYALWSSYNPATDEIIVGWNRPKDKSDKYVDVKYAFTSFHANGGFDSHGVAAPNGTNIMPNEPTYTPNPYNQMMWRSGAGGVEHLGQDAIYVALKHQDSVTAFREIRIPLTAAGYPTFGGSN